VFAKYLSLSDIAQYNVEPVLDEISKLQDQGYSLAKSWFGPRWRDYREVPKDFCINHPRLEPIFQALEDNSISLIIHMGDPDTYYASQYWDSEKYGTKDEHLKQLEDVLSRRAPRGLSTSPPKGMRRRCPRSTIPATCSRCHWAG
jgi:signal recognition particle subunit SEC65